MRQLVVLVALAGCTFTPAGDAPAPGGTDGGITPTANDACPVDDPSLTLCLDFDHAITPFATDGSRLGRDAATVDITTTDRDGDPAIAVTEDSFVDVPPDLDADPALTVPMTVELWIDPTGSSDHHRTVIDAQTFEIEQHTDGSLSCDLGDQEARGPRIASGTWTHVACTYDGKQTRMFVNGDVTGCATVGKLPHDSLDVGALQLGNELDGGHAFVGGLDDIRMYTSLLDDATLCARAGRSTCHASCPSE